MHIACDYQSVEGKKTGIGISAENLISHLRVQKPDWRWTLYKTDKEQDLNTPRRMLWEGVVIPGRAKKDKADLIYSPGFASAPFSKVPTVVTVHDLIGMIYPDNLPPAARFYWSKWLPWCVSRAKVTVASSQSTKKDMIRLLGMSEKSIRVVPLAAHERFIKKTDEQIKDALLSRLGLNKPYYLTVGTLEPRKNLPGLLEAFKAALQTCGPVMQLALVGKAGGQESELGRLIKKLGLEKDVSVTGYLTDEELCELYNSALGYAIVSKYEGFGLPVLEAMQCGKSGVCAEVSSLPEIAGDTCVYVDPHDIESMTAGLIDFYKNTAQRADLEQRAFLRSKQFTWDKTAQSMIEVFEGLI